ncbi:MAG: nucleotidyltransferase domain-containing protein [Candidatus Peribacteraceae bacterium]
MENASLARLFRQIADLLDYQGVQFKPAAYRHAAQTIEDLPKDIAEMTEKKELMKLPGIGEALADKIIEYCTTGKIRVLDHLVAETSMGASGLLSVEDLGPRRVREIEQHLDVRTIPELIEAAQIGRLRTLPGFSEILEKKILENAQRAKEGAKRFPRPEVEADVERLLKALRGIGGVNRSEAAGSYRRHKETVGDIDILIGVQGKKVTENVAHSVADAARKFPKFARMVAEGPTKISFDIKSGLRVDIRIVRMKEWGSAFLYFTGTKEHNIMLRRLAIERGLKLNEYGLFRGSKSVVSETEEDIYRALGLKFIEPKERTEILPS